MHARSSTGVIRRADLFCVIPTEARHSRRRVLHHRRDVEGLKQGEANPTDSQELLLLLLSCFV